MRNLLKGGFRRLAGLQQRRALGDRCATVIAVSTQKGGVGKTTTSVSLASALARYENQRVLLLDLDPQGHVATAINKQLRPGGGNLSQVLTDESSDREVMDIICRTTVPNLDVTPLDRNLGSTEDLLGTRIGKEYILRDKLQVTRTYYDVIVIDCPPNIGNLTLNALVAADQVLIPCDPSPLSLNGVHKLIQTITTIAARLNPTIDVLGVLLTRVDGRNKLLNQSIRGQIEQEYGTVLLPLQIGTSTSLAQAQAQGEDIFGYDHRCRAAKQYQALAGYISGELVKE
ncbi:MAG: ParA family protein [Proteobacteria bacterium]|nr:ParA family protein [Pseudomonadota bacterium]